VRIAPSPTGFFHVGGARTALYNWAIAKQQGGTFVLRIEDTDLERNQDEATQGIISALAWLGIDRADPTFEGPYFQSDYADAHVEAANRLFASGHAYYCDLTPDEIAERAKANGKPGYDGYSRDRGLGPAPGRVLRFRVPEGGPTVVHDLIRGDVTFDHANIEDFVLLRGNGTPLFLLANVVDDVEMGITLVVRGDEHLANTPKQQLLWEALERTPPTWAHVPVLVNEKRQKLSKRRDKVALEQYRDEGYLAAAMINYLMTLGWSPGSGHRTDAQHGDTEIVPWSVIEATFDLADVTQSPAFFDLKKLAAFNGDYIRRLGVDEFVTACEPWIPEHYDRSVFAAMAPHVQTRVVTLAEAPPMVDFLMRDAPVLDEDAWRKAMHQPWSRAVLAETVAAYMALGEWTADSLKSSLERVAAAHELKLGKAQAPIRVAVTGTSVGPPLFESLEVLGRDGTIQRLDAAVGRLPRD
jgi:glutamyl-tRNA synthetase